MYLCCLVFKYRFRVVYLASSSSSFCLLTAPILVARTPPAAPCPLPPPPAPSPSSYSDFATRSALTPAFASIGVPLVSLARGGVSWAFIGRKGSTLATALSSQEYVSGGVSGRSLFRCYSQAVSVPENAGNGSRLLQPPLSSLAYRPGPITYGGSAAIQGGSMVSSTMFVVTSSPLSSESTGSYTVSTGLAERAFDTGWMQMQSQTGANSYRTGYHGLQRQTETLRVQVGGAAR